MMQRIDLFITGHNTKLFQLSIAYNSVLIYNKLSHEFKSVTCIMKFKQMIINFFLEKGYILWKNL